MKKLLIILLSIILVGSLGYIGYQEHTKNEKQEELARNRKYEISLVKALKNTYKDIEKIRIYDPHYSQKPGGWGCNVTIHFSDEFVINYSLGYKFGDEETKSASIGGTPKDIQEKTKKLKKHYGVTEKIITVYYSNGEKGEQ